MSRIVIDARLYSESGIGRYIRNLVTYLQQLDKRNKYFILLLKKDFESIRLAENFTPILANFRWYGFSEQLILPRLLNSLRADLVHFPHFNVPILFKGKFVVTIHDLIHQHFQTKRATTHDPITYKIKKYGYKKVFSHAVRDCAKIITPSDFVKQQIVREWKLNPDKIIVTWEAVEDDFLKLVNQSTPEDFKRISQKYNFTKPYLFYVGNAHPHKNIPLLIKAFGKLRQKYPNLTLILSGPSHHFWQQIQKQTNQKGVIFTGFISEQELVTLYKNAQIFVLPSLEEGFGIPLLEAMSCSCPVISSNVASLPEVGGDAPVYFDPRSEDDLVKKINKVLNDKGLQQSLIKRGQRRYQQFSWEKLARQTLKIYKSV